VTAHDAHGHINWRGLSVGRGRSGRFADSEFLHVLRTMAHEDTTVT
jgi:hypothetical protein